jgi:hypothetical protein
VVTAQEVVVRAAWVYEVALASSSFVTVLMYDPSTLPQRNASRWPARHCGPICRLGHLEVIHPSDVLNNAHAATVPNIDPKGKVRLGFHGQVRLELTLARR